MLKFAKSDRVRQAGRISPELTETKKQKVQEVREVLTETTELETLFKQYENLRKSHEDFEKFLSVVLSDLTVKKDCLRKIKDCEKSKRNDKSYASVQLFMLTQYNHRINRFKEVADDSLEDICKKHGQENDVTNLVTKHIDVLGKMKRRMKHMVDVSEKYAVSDIFDTLNMLNEMEEELNPQIDNTNDDNFSSIDRRVRKMSRQSKSLFSIHNTYNEESEVESSSPRQSRVQSLGGSAMSSSSSESSSTQASMKGDGLTCGRGPKMNTFRSLTDHLAVLTKSYTSRR